MGSTRDSEEISGVATHAHWSNSPRGSHGQLFMYLPASIVAYPASCSAIGNVGRVSRTSFWSTPVSCSYRPETICARDGQQSDVFTYARLNRTPWSTNWL
jgi:hypothetical protein